MLGREYKAVDRGHYFSVELRGHKINHSHKVDFFVNQKVFIECKAVEKLMSEHRLQLWNRARRGYAELVEVRDALARVRRMRSTTARETSHSGVYHPSTLPFESLRVNYAQDRR